MTKLLTIQFKKINWGSIRSKQYFMLNIKQITTHELIGGLVYLYSLLFPVCCQQYRDYYTQWGTHEQFDDTKGTIRNRQLYEESISRNFNTSLGFNKHNGVYVKLNILNSNVSFYHHASSAILILSSDNSFVFHSVVNGNTMCRYSKLYLWNTLNVHA